MVIVIFLFLVAFLMILFLIVSVLTLFKGAPLVATTERTIKRMIDLSGATSKDTICDLGSGDGRIVIAFAKKGIHATGYEINPFLVVWSNFQIKRLGLSKIAHVYLGDFLDKELTNYSVVIVFGISYIMKRLEKKLQNELQPGSTVLSLGFKFPTWKITTEDNGLYIYKVL